MPDVNPNDRKALEASLADWQARLKHERYELSKAQQATAQVNRVMQVARARVARREAQLKRLDPHTPGTRLVAVHNALSFVGTVEHPAGSNTGPSIDAWQRLWGIHAQPWCGAFAGAMLASAGCHLTPRIVYTPYIYDDAKAGVNGLDRVVWQRGQTNVVAHSGDLVLYDFATAGGIKHVGILRAPWRVGQQLLTVEGNTSFGDGSQDNGGCVAMRTRDISLAHSIVSAKWR